VVFLSDSGEPDFDCIGIYYPICRVAKIRDKDSFPVWQVDNSNVLLVKISGGYEFHKKDKILANDFSSPLSICFNTFINMEYIHLVVEPAVVNSRP
jgi:hypothetical protein